MSINLTTSLSDIVYFIEVAQTKNISRAAERLGITQPSLSLAIKRVEDSMGAVLFIRGRKGVQLTKAGKEFLGRGRILLHNWSQLKAEVNKKENSVSGQYVIGCHPSVALYTLSGFLPKLVQQFPELEIKLNHDLSRKITEQVISFEIDFGIVVNPVRHPDLVIKEMYYDDVLFWTAKVPSSTQVLDSDKGVLLCDLNLNQTQKLIADLEKKNLGFRRVIQSTSLEVLTDLTASGVGIGVLPKRVATRIPSYGLVPLDKSPIFKDKICLVYRADTQKTKAAQVIIEAIKKSAE